MKFRNRLSSLIAGASVATVAVALFAPPALAAPGDPLISTDFEDGTYDGWDQSGDPNLTVVEKDGSQVLHVDNWAENYDGIKSKAGLFSDLTPGDAIDVSMRVLLGEGLPDTEARFVTDPGFHWIGNTPITAADWATIEGTYTIPSDVDPADLQLYVGVEPTTDTPGDYYLDDIVITASTDTDPGDPTEPTEPVESLNTDFEGDLNGWGPRDDGSGAPTVELSDAKAHGGDQSVLITDRVSDGSGLGRDVTGVMQSGKIYELNAWVTFGDGQETDDVWLSIASTTDGTTSYSTLKQFTGMSNSEWVEVTASFQIPSGDEFYLYFETAYEGGNTSDFFIDDITVRVPDPAAVQDLPPLFETVPFPLGVAVDSRELTGSPAELLTLHFNQVTSENYMKPEAWYDSAGEFRLHTEAAQLMEFAQANDLALYGHTLVWHSQTPDWFFENGSGDPLTSSAADQAILRDRMRTHIFDVAQALSDDYGLFGSTENPLNAFDVVNEVVSDSGANEDGLRRSRWYQVLGEDYLDLAFQYADEAFNDVYAADGTNRPVALFINDYNTEQSGKQLRLHALVKRMLDRGVPIDGVGHQFHLNLSTPVSALEAALDLFSDLDVIQAVTELDVTTGTPVTEANLIEQGYYYRDAFNIFRDHASNLFSVTVWGLTDGRSWRNDSGAPLLFDDALQAKHAFYGVAGGEELPPHMRTANVFQPSEELATDSVQEPEWNRLPLIDIETAGSFQLRWDATGLIAYVEVAAADAADFEELQFTWGDETGTLARDGSGSIEGVVTETDDGYAVVAELPRAGQSAGDTLPFDVRIVGANGTAGWNTAGVTGTLTLVEALSYVAIPQADSAPAIDGEIDPVWESAAQVSTDKAIVGENGATADVRTLWQEEILFVLLEVTDPDVDLSGSDPWIQDSVEIYVDPGNAKNGPYRYEDSQIRISADNDVSFGTGDEQFQRDRVESATSRTDDGYIVEVAITLGEIAAPGSFHGMDFQVNDATDGDRTAIRNWADPSNAGYQSTARWGVGEFVTAVDEPDPDEPGGPGDDGDDTDPGTGSDDDDDNGATPGDGDGSGGSEPPANGDAAPGQGGGKLPRTGADSLPLAALAIALILAGGSTLAIRRRSVSMQ